MPEALRRRPPALLLAGPPAAPSAAAIASALPGTLVLVAGPVQGARAANVAVLRYSPEEAFAEAGRRAAAAGPDCVVGVLAPAASGAASAFREGFLSTGAPARLRERTIAASSDRTELRRAVDDLFAQGVRLFLVALRSATPQCLEMLEGRGVLLSSKDRRRARRSRPSFSPRWSRTGAPRSKRRSHPQRSGGLRERSVFRGDWSLRAGSLTALPGRAPREPGQPRTARAAVIAVRRKRCTVFRARDARQGKLFDKARTRSIIPR